MRDGLALLTWQSDTFAYAESFDDAGGRYRGLRGGQGVMLSAEDVGLIVKPEVGRRQLDAEAPQPGTTQHESTTADTSRMGTTTAAMSLEPAVPRLARRFHGTVRLDPTRVGRDAGRIADEVIAHLAGLVGADVAITLEIDAKIPSGAPETVVRTVTENSRPIATPSSFMGESFPKIRSRSLKHFDEGGLSTMAGEAIMLRERRSPGHEPKANTRRLQRLSGIRLQPSRGQALREKTVPTFVRQRWLSVPALPIWPRAATR
jgi:hypothetical protein